MAITVAMRTQVTQLYVSLFGRAPDAEGLGFWVKALDNGMSFANLAQQMYNTAPARAYYPEFATNQEIVRTFYQYVLGRPADDEGLAFWVRELEAAPSKGAFFTKILNNVVNYAGTDPAGLKSQAWFLNRVEVAQYYAEHDGDIAGATPVLDGVTDVDATVIAAKAMIDGEVATGQTFMLTAGFDQFIGGNRGGALGDTYLGTAENGFIGNGTQSTFNPGDAIDGGTGSNTLRLFMGQGATADGVAVSNIQTLDLRLNANNGLFDAPHSNLVMTDWDASLEQINIRSNKSSIDIVDQQVIADVSISDQSTVNGEAYYGFNYAAGVVDGAADGLSVTLDNVNGTEGAGVYIDGGIEQLDLTVADRAGTVATPNRYASDVNLYAEGVTALTVDAGRAGQTFTLSANVADGADFDSTAFAGNMVLDSANIETATFGAGSDTATFSGVADSEDAAYNMGEGDNRLTLNVAFAGAALAGAGADTILANSTLDGSSISAGNGINRVTIAGEHAGAITTGTGADTVGVVSTAVTGTIDVGNGDNTVTAGAHAGDIDAGTGNDSITVTTTAAGSGIHAGSGNNTIVATAHAGEITTTDGNDSVTVASTAAGSSISVGDGTNTVAVTADHEGAIAAGNGKNTVSVGEDMLTGSSITVGNGNENLITVTGSVIDDADDTNKNTSIVVGSGNGNIIDINGYVYNSTITVGDGDNNSLDIAGSLSATAPGTVTFGDGDNNSITIGGSIISESVVVGTGTGAEIDVTGSVTTGSSIEVAGQATTLNVDGSIIGGSSVELGNGANVVTVGGNIDNASSVTLGNGANVATIEGDILAGSTVSFGSGADTLTLGSADNSALIKGTDVKSVVNMGDGNDSVTLLTEVNEVEPTEPSLNVLVQSAGFLNGQGGSDDTLTVNAADQLQTLYVIDRTQNQQVTIDFSGETFALNDKVKVTFTRGTETFYVEYTVSAADFIQGPDAVATKVAQSVAAKLSANGTYDAHFAAASAASGVVTIVSDNPHEDFVITATDGVVDVVQISDARITSFETLNLVALEGVDADYSTINANFDLIDGTHNVNLDSQVQLDPVVVNDNYETFEQGGVTTFELDNLKGGEAISVSGYEATATGNRQVVTLTVDNDENDHVVGDKLTVIVDGVEMPAYVVTAADLVSDNAQDDANNIADSLAAHILAQLGNASGWTVKVEDNVIYLVGDTESTSDIGVKHTRVDSEFEVYEGTQTTWDVSEGLELLQAGDVITVTLGDQVETYTVTQEDCDRQQAEHISEYFAAQFDGATAGWGIVDLGEEADVVVTRVVENVIGQTTANNVQTATSTDDSETDVVIDAFLSDDAVNTTMDLTVAGEGDFDLAIRGDSGFTDLDLTLGDAHSHYIDTIGDQGNFAETITVADLAGVNTAGQTITLDYVLAHTVDTAESAANFVIDQYAVRKAYNGDASSFLAKATEIPSGVTTLMGAMAGDADAEYASDVFKFTHTGGPLTLLMPSDDSPFDTNLFLFNALGQVLYGDDDGQSGIPSSADSGFTVDIPAGVYYVAVGPNNIGAFETLADFLEGSIDHFHGNGDGANDPALQKSEIAELVGAEGGPFYEDGDVGPYTLTFSVPTGGALTSVSATVTEDEITNVFRDETITVSTSGGDDHLTTLAQSAFNEGSSINLGTGVNRLSLGWGDDVVVANEGAGELDFYNLPLHPVSATLETTTDTIDSMEELIAGGNNGKSVTTVEVGTRVDARLNDELDWDLFAVVLEAGKTYQVSFFSGDTAGYDDEDLGMRVYNSNKEDISEEVAGPVFGQNGGLDRDTFDIDGDVEVDSYNGEGVLFTPTTSGVYYFEISNNDFVVKNTGDYGFEVSEISNEATPLPAFEDINFTGSLHQFDVLNDIDMADGSVWNMNMPGGVDNVSVLTMTDLNVADDGLAFVTIDGAATDFTIESAEDFGQDQNDRVVLEVLGVENLTMTAGDEINIQLNGAELNTVDLYAYDDIDFEMDGSDGDNADFVNLTSITLAADDEVDAVLRHVRSGASLTVYADDNHGGSGDVDINLSHVTLGDVSVETGYAYEDSDIHISDTNNDDVTVGNITMVTTAEKADELPLTSNNELNIDDNHTVDMQLGNIFILGADTGFFIGRDDENTDLLLVGGDVSLKSITGEDFFSGDNADFRIESNSNSDITFGNVTLESGSDYSELNIYSNDETNVSLAADGVVTLESCGGDANVIIEYNRNDYDPFENGPDLGAEMAKTYTVTLGDVVLDAGDDTYFDVSENNDATYFGDLAVIVGDVNAVAYDYSDFTIDNNWSTTVVVGEVNMLSQQDANIDIYNNDGRLYTTSWGNQDRQEIDYADITMGDVTAESTESYAEMYIEDNNQTAIAVGDVSLTASDYADFYVENNDTYFNNESSSAEALSEVTIDVESVTLVAETSSDFWIEYNDAEAGYNIASSDDSASIDITIGDVDMTAGTYAYFGIYDNNVDAGEDGSAEVNIEAADITLDAAEESYFTIEDNTVYSEGDGNDNTATLNITLGAIDMTSGSDADSDTGFEVEGTDVTAYEFGDASATVTIESVSIQSDNYTYVYIYSTDAEAYGDFATASSTVDIGFVDVTSENGAFVQIYDNNAYAGTESFDFTNDASIDISVDAVTVTVGGEDDADFSIGSNDAVVYGFASDANEATVNVDVVSVTLDAGEDANFDIDDNDAVVEFDYPSWGDQDNNNTSVDITVGDVEIDADQDANFDIDDNDAWVRSGYGEDNGNTTSVAIAVEAVTMTAGQDANFAIDDNDAFVGGEDWFNSVSVDIEVADVSMDASDDVSFVIEDNDADDFAPNIGYSNSATVNVTTGEVTIDAGDDVYYFVDGTVSTSVTQGDVTITAGLDKATAESDEDVSSDVYFHFVEVEGTANISIEAQSNANGEGNIYGYVEDAYDLETLTLTGTNAELYLVDDIGVDNDTNVFTLDVTGMTGSFSEGASNYVPLGDDVDNNIGQDDGVYIETWDANFGGDVVRVEIGSSDLIYNATYTGEDNNWGYPWNDSEYGWYSLGDYGDFSPVPQLQVISGFEQDRYDLGDDSYATWYNAIQFEQSGQSYRAQVSFSEYDPWLSGNDTWDGVDNTPDYYKLDNDGSWDLISEAQLVSELGIADIYYTAEGTGTTYGDWVLVGAPDGTAFTVVQDTQQVKWNTQWSSIYDGVSGNPIDLLSSNSRGEEAQDNWGQTAKEVFTFTGDSIGEIVIGGFSVGAWGSVNPDNGRLTDRLDFSQFDWNADGEANDAGLVNLSYFDFSVEDGDGYFKDVVITFIGGENLEEANFESIRLVGVGEFDNAVTMAQASVIFA